jgi:OmpA-OmpF porin, OOP family
VSRRNTRRSRTRRILTAQAREEIEKGTAERQAVLIQAREREAQQRTQQAHEAQARADTAAQRASTLEEELADLKAEKTDRGIVVMLGDVMFDTAQATLKPSAYVTIDRLASALKEDTNRKVTIEGHTDSVGTDAYNQSLSERRAAAVQAALFERGVAASQITTRGMGETTPVVSNDDAGGRQQNRRVELVLARSELGHRCRLRDVLRYGR